MNPSVLAMPLHSKGAAAQLCGVTPWACNSVPLHPAGHTTVGLQVVRHYPRLLEHHLRLCGEAKHEFDRQSFAQWSVDIKSNPRKQGAHTKGAGGGRQGVFGFLVKKCADIALEIQRRSGYCGHVCGSPCPGAD